MFKRDLELEKKWSALLGELESIIGKKPKDLNSVLFLIGVQELGRGTKIFSKEEKQDLMHIATCKLFSLSGYYELTGLDEQGWPHYRSIKPIPNLPLKDQEKVLRWHILEYFEQEI